MKHLKDAKQLYMLGDSKGALNIIEDILALSPKNIEALNLKAIILDSWGHFEESLQILQKISNYAQIDDENALSTLDRRISEDRDSLIYSKLTEEGRWYFSFSPVQVFIAVFGLVGCLLFLISSPLYFQKDDSFLFLGLSFFILVLFPWMLLFILHFQGVKKILIGLQGISVFYGFSKQFSKWHDIGSAVIEYDPDLNKNYLHLLLYDTKGENILFDFNISQKNSDVFARRHFVKSILTQVKTVTYLEHSADVLDNAEDMMELEPEPIKQSIDE